MPKTAHATGLCCVRLSGDDSATYMSVTEDDRMSVGTAQSFQSSILSPHAGGSPSGRTPTSTLGGGFGGGLGRLSGLGRSSGAPSLGRTSGAPTIGRSSGAPSVLMEGDEEGAQSSEAAMSAAGSRVGGPQRPPPP